MTFKEFNAKINILSKKLNISIQELKTWKFKDIIKSLELMELI